MRIWIRNLFVNNFIVNLIRYIWGTKLHIFLEINVKNPQKMLVRIQYNTILTAKQKYMILFCKKNWKDIGHKISGQKQI